MDLDSESSRNHSIIDNKYIQLVDKRIDDIKEETKREIITDVEELIDVSVRNGHEQLTKPEINATVSKSLRDKIAHLREELLSEIVEKYESFSSKNEEDHEKIKKMIRDNKKAVEWVRRVQIM